MYTKIFVLTLISTWCFMHNDTTLLDPSFTGPKIQDKTSVEAIFANIDKRIEPLVEGVQKKVLESLKEIYETPLSKKNYDNTVRKFDRLIAQTNLIHEILTITAFTHRDPKTQDLANKGIETLNHFSIDQFTLNQNLYKAFKDYTQNNGTSETLASEDQYFLTECMDRFKRDGLHLKGEEFQALQDLKKEIAKLENTFEVNIQKDDSGIWTSKQDLCGTTPSLLENLKSEKNLYFVGVDYPTYTAVMQTCTNRDTRKKLYTAYMNRAYPENSKILDTLRKKRHLLAKKLGFKSYTELDLSDQMIKKDTSAYAMINTMAPKLQEKLASEKELLVKELDKYIPSAKNAPIEPHDLTYLVHQYKKDKLSVNEEKIAEYFPFERVLTGLFTIYSKFFGLTFSLETIQLFDNKISLIKVEDGDKTLGFIGLDLFPRKNKYSHACCCMVVPPFYRKGLNDPALSFIIANFTPKTKSRPALLRHSEVQTFYHEFGHALHALVGTSNNVSLAGYNTKIDFVELPSQILEEWLFDPEILQQVSSHYSRNTPLEKNLLEKKIAAKTFNSAHFVLRQIALTQICLDYFSDNTAIDTNISHQKIIQHYLPHIKMPKDNNFVASFGHLSGYGAKYYSYLYSRILALDLFFFIKDHGGLLNQTIGRNYLDNILRKAGCQDPAILIKEFLSREPNENSFLQSIGVHP